MFDQLAKLILTVKAACDVIKEKAESKALDLAMQVNNFRQNASKGTNSFEGQKCHFKDKLKEELLHLITEINHRAKLKELNLKGVLKQKLIDLTNNALLDSMELNDIRAELASLRAELAELKSQIPFIKR